LFGVIDDLYAQPRPPQGILNGCLDYRTQSQFPGERFPPTIGGLSRGR
jgi:hypothetical protein